MLRRSGLIALLFAPTVMAAEAQGWLERMAQASRQQSYQGAFVYERTGSFTTHQIWHQVDGDAVTERLVQTDGPLQEWLRRDGQLVCASTLMPGIVWHDIPDVTEQPAQLDDWYVLQVLGTTRVASRPVTVIALTPRDSFRYAYELYLDNETGLLLKSLLINERNTLLERFQFAVVELGAVPADSLTVTSLCLDREAPRTNDGAYDDRWQPDWLPPGFVLGHQRTQPLNNGMSITTQVYTDGLARFSLFVEPLGADGLADDLRAQLGPTVAVSRKLRTVEGEFLATVVGEIPPEAAERIADSLLPGPDEAVN